MRFQLKQLVLWPRKAGLGPRTLSFEAGRLNVITGASKTGKSAVIPLIDYCLGSDRCAVPVRTIRDACSWFGVIVATSEGEKLLARREPGDQQSTGDMFILEATTVTLPNVIEGKNTNVDAVKRMLDRLAGLSNLGFDSAGVGGGFQGRPSFRDLLAFNLQPQNIVANPDVLFFKADTLEHKEKLRTVFPYVLGAITPELLAKRWEAEQLERELRRKDRVLTAQTQVSQQWRAELQAWIAEARDLGLLSPTEAAAAQSEGDMVAALETVVTKTSAEVELTVAAVDAASTELAEIEREESQVALELSETRSRMEHMARLRASVEDYAGAIRKQKDRLSLSRWLRDQSAKSEGGCPVCGGAYERAQQELDSLCDALAGLEASARQLDPVPAAFDRELVAVRDDVRRLTDRFSAVRTRRKSVEERSTRIRDERWKASSVDRFLGRSEQALRLFKAPQADTSLADEIARLRIELAALRAAVSEGDVRTRQAAALRRVSGFMTRMLPMLDAERPNDTPELLVEDLTVRVVGTSGRADYLWEIGSGANWLSYHVSALLGLQELFLEQGASPVPNFLVLDQPSQVYFPRRMAGEAPKDDDPELGDEDVAAIRKVFDVLSAAIARAKGGLQVLVLDHAGANVWGQGTEAHLVEEWRNGKALVPSTWFGPPA